MPLYEYKCGQCGEVFEVLQKFSDAPLTVHPGCGGTVARLISPPAFQFKGSGWYITDYARKNGGGSRSGEDGGKKPETKPAESKSTSSDTTATKS